MTQSAEDFFARARAAAEAGDAAGWETNLRACIAVDPNHTNALLNLGMLLSGRREFGEAEALLRRSLAAQPSVEGYTALAEVFEGTNRPAKAEARYRDILKVLPQHVPTLKRLGELYERSENAETAAAYFKQAWDIDPKDIGAGIAYAIAMVDLDPAVPAAVLDQLLSDNASDDAARLKILNKLLLFKEFHERMKRGLMPHHATSISELFFTHCAAGFSLFRDLALKGVTERPNDPNAVMNQFIALFCSRDKSGAQACLDRLLSAVKNHPLCIVNLKPDFYRSLETKTDDAILAGLPPLIDVRPIALTAPHITYLSCNFRYFANFAIPLLRSFADLSPGGQAHVHIMDATNEELQAAASFCAGLASVTVAVSAERPDIEKQGGAAARNYYHSIRFIRFYQHLKQYGRTLWMMDVDALFNRNANEMYEVLGEKDAAFRIRAGRFEPWNQFSAGVIGASAKPASITYFRLIAAYIAHYFQRGELQWGIDQFAMYGTYSYLEDQGRAPEVAFLDNRVMDQQYLPEGIVWFTAGKKKFSRPDVDPNVPASKRDALRMKYWTLFDKYSLKKDASPARPTG